MAAAQALRAFQGCQRAPENDYFPHLTLGSVSIVILKIFYVENHDGKLLKTSIGAGFRIFYASGKCAIFFLNFWVRFIFHS